MKGDTAQAVGYSFVVLKEGDRWFLWRAAINEWTLVRTPDGWRIKERYEEKSYFHNVPSDFKTPS